METDIQKLAEEIIEGRRITRGDETDFFGTAPLEELCAAADMIREKLCGNHVDLCAIINGRSGGCSEDCKFCAQSCRHNTGVENHGFMA